MTESPAPTLHVGRRRGLLEPPLQQDLFKIAAIRLETPNTQRVFTTFRLQVCSNQINFAWFNQALKKVR
ncbi:MAG: hypothetical protein ABL933_08145 [Methyloglobulus sp.]|nr:hypothetical protein [Methyloglobulus sp.]